MPGRPLGAPNFAGQGAIDAEVLAPSTGAGPAA